MDDFTFRNKRQLAVLNGYLIGIHEERSWSDKKYGNSKLHSNFRIERAFHNVKLESIHNDIMPQS